MSFLGRKAALDLFLFAQLAVKAHLFVEISIESAATEQHQKSSDNFS